MNLEQIQCFLGGLGYYTLRYSQPPRKGDLAIDRIEGPALTAAVRSFQKDNGLTVDGMCGPETEKAIRKAIYEDREKPTPAAPDNPEDIPAAVWAFLVKTGFPPAAAAGIMGNIDAESAMKPTNLEDQYERAKGYTDQSYTAAVDDGSYPNFATDKCGYGICQWTAPASRKAGLLNLAHEKGLSVGSLEVQLEWLWYELRTKFPSMVKQLQQPGISVYAATSIFMCQFENPLHQEPEYIQRRANTSQMYYNRYSK